MQVTPVDALIVINYLNANSNGEAESEGPRGGLVSGGAARRAGDLHDAGVLAWLDENLLGNHGHTGLKRTPGPGMSSDALEERYYDWVFAMLLRLADTAQFAQQNGT